MVTLIIEAAAGAALLLATPLAARLLLGVPLETSGALTVARVCGTGLLALGVACWFSGDDSQSRAASGLVVEQLLYNVATAAILAYAGLGLRLQGTLLWPAVLLHAAMSGWCITAPRRKVLKGRLNNSWIR